MGSKSVNNEKEHFEPINHGSGEVNQTSHSRIAKNHRTQRNSVHNIEVPQVVSSDKKTRNHKPLLTFDKKCLSCVGDGGNATSQIPTMIKAFRMACLSYQPSKVKFDNIVHERN